MSGLPPAAVLVSVEGTASPRAFVREVLQPAAQAGMAALLAQDTRPEVAAALAEVARLVPGQAPLVTLRHWMEQDAPMPPLRALQALVWDDLFSAAPPEGAVYPDVPTCLRLWARVGLRLYGFCSGPAEIARVLFGHAPGGTLEDMFAAFFDPKIGNRHEPDTYIRLAIAMNVPTVEVLFLCDDEAELDAAAAAGMRTCQVLRGAAGGSRRHRVAADFAEAAGAFGLPAAH